MAVIRAVLIGVSRYERDETIHPIPNVVININELKDILLDDSVVGLDIDSLFISVNQNLTDIKTLLAEICENTKQREDTILIYYSGHGFLSKKNRSLYLTATDTKEKFLETTGFRIEEFKDIIGYSKAGKKLVILDCCYSGKVIGTMGYKIEEQLDRELKKFDINGTTGTFVMASSDENSPSYYDDLNPNTPTYFTNELLKNIKYGAESQQEYWSLVDLFEKIKDDLQSAGQGAVPLNKIIGDGGKIKIIKNKLYINEHAYWQAAIENNKIEIYFDFINRFPNSFRLAEAKSRIKLLEEELLLKEILVTRKLDACNLYLKSYTNGLYVEKVKQIRTEIIQNLFDNQEELLWNETKTSNNIEQLKFFIIKYPSSQYANEAINLINQLTKNSIEKTNRQSSAASRRSRERKHIVDDVKSLLKNLSFFNWIVFIVGAALLAAVINYLIDVYLYQSGENGQPQLSKEVEQNETSAKEQNLSESSEKKVNQNQTPEDFYNEGKKFYELKEYEQAVHWFQKAAEQGNALGQVYLGHMYDKGLGGLAQDYQQAVYWFSQSAEKGEVLAQSVLGQRYLKGWGVAQNDEQAVYWFRKAAEQGDGLSQAKMGYMYQKGRGRLPKDDHQAAYWYQKGAIQGNMLAQASIGLMYEEGSRGFDKDIQQAIYWYQKAARQGHEFSQERLKLLNESW